MIENTIAAWHKIIKTKDAAGLDDILADNVVFHSPIVHTPQRGQANHHTLSYRGTLCFQ